MTTSNSKQVSERQFSSSDSLVNYNKPRFTRSKAQQSSFTTSDMLVEHQYVSPLNMEGSKGFSQISTLPQQQTIPVIIKPERSSMSTRGKRHSDSNLSIHKQQKVPQTPEREQFKPDQEPTSRKNEHSLSFSGEEDHTSSLPLLNNGKKRSLLDLASPYYQQRKSYRKMTVRKDRDFIPFRRNQDALQGKIVNILNKLVNGKTCYKELQHLAEKMNRLTSKELLNKYIISGFQVITKLVIETYDSEKDSFEENLISKIKETNLKIAELIEHELDNCEEFDQQEEESEIDEKTLQKYLIRKIYTLLKQINREQKPNGVLKEKALRISQNFIRKDSFQKRNVIRLLQRVQQNEFVERDL